MGVFPTLFCTSCFSLGPSWCFRDPPPSVSSQPSLTILSKSTCLAPCDHLLFLSLLLLSFIIMILYYLFPPVGIQAPSKRSLFYSLPRPESPDQYLIHSHHTVCYSLNEWTINSQLYCLAFSFAFAEHKYIKCETPIRNVFGIYLLLRLLSYLLSVLHEKIK